MLGRLRSLFARAAPAASSSQSGGRVDHGAHVHARAGRISTSAQRIFEARFAAAVQGRIAAGAGSVKALAAVCGDVDPSTFRAWIDQRQRVPAWAVYALAEHFCQDGDPGFLADLFDDLIEHPAETRLREARRAIEDAARLLGRDGGT